MLGGCAQAQPAALAIGKQQPTIVSLNPCADAILAEVSAPEQLLAISHYSHNAASTSMALEKALTFKATGGTVEEILALNPEVVVGSSFMAPATRAALENSGIRIETLGIASSVEASLEQVRSMAAITGQPARGQALVREIEQAMMQSASPKPPIATVLWQPGGIVPGEGALVTELMEHTGFASHSAARGLQQADFVSLERMLSDPPQLLLVAGQERSQAHPVLKRLTHLRTESFNANLLYCGGPTIVRALARLVEIRG